MILSLKLNGIGSKLWLIIVFSKWNGENIIIQLVILSENKKIPEFRLIFRDSFFETGIGSFVLSDLIAMRESSLILFGP